MMKPGHRISTRKLEEVTAGGRDYIRTKDGQVKGLALRPDLNPRAPEVIIVGNGPNIVRRAELLLGSQSNVPAFIKCNSGEWEYRGDYRAIAYCTDRATIGTYRDSRPANSVAGILFLEKADGDPIENRNQGFPNAALRREVEKAAVKHVTQMFQSIGYLVADRQRDNCGYDLLASRGKKQLRIEVKGTYGPIQRFFISRNERAASHHRDWRLAVVTSATTTPEMKLLNRREAEEQFIYDPLVWDCTPNRS